MFVYGTVYSTSLQDFCQKSASELRELKEGQMKLKMTIDAEIPNNNTTTTNTTNANITPDKSSPGT